MEETTIEETTTTETTEHNPVITLEQMDFNGVLPDGEYIVMISSFDEDCSGAMFNVNGYWRLSEEEYNNLQVGDTIYFSTDTDNERYVVYEGNGWLSNCGDNGFLQKQANGYYYLWGDNDVIYSYHIISNYHLSFAPDIEVFSDAEVLGQEYPNVNYLDGNNKLYESPFKYNNIQEFIRDVKENIDGTIWGCYIKVENGLVVIISANPQLHEPWMSKEVWEKYHSQ